jgi:hypothetical protein
LLEAAPCLFAWHARLWISLQNKHGFGKRDGQGKTVERRLLITNPSSQTKTSPQFANFIVQAASIANYLVHQ